MGKKFDYKEWRRIFCDHIETKVLNEYQLLIPMNFIRRVVDYNAPPDSAAKRLVEMYLISRETEHRVGRHIDTFADWLMCAAAKRIPKSVTQNEEYMGYLRARYKAIDDLVDSGKTVTGALKVAGEQHWLALRYYKYREAMGDVKVNSGRGGAFRVESVKKKDQP